MRINYYHMGILCLTMQLGGTPIDIESFLRPYADAIVGESEFAFTDKLTGEQFAGGEHPAIRQNLTIESEYLHWRYTSALVYEGLWELGHVLNEKQYSEFGKRAFSFFFDSLPYFQKVQDAGFTIEGLENFNRFKNVWNDGAQTAALLHYYPDDPRQVYLDYMKRVSEFFFTYDESAGGKPRNLNVDQLYTKAVFMARMGSLTEDSRYYDYCIEEIRKTERLFLDPTTGLYDQYYYPHLETTNNIKWLRGMGWAAIAMVNVLEELPLDHPGYDGVLRTFQKLIIAVSSYQTKSGLWRHLVDRSDCFVETSGSTYMVYAIAKGINSGFLDPLYRDVAMAGWKGITQMQDEDGNIGNVTIGVSSSTSPSYYYNNAFDEAGSHFYGPLFLAGAEMIKLYQKYDGPRVRGWDLK